ncbi:MAG: hypothetical protein ISR90_06665 [Candidatus Marinimicrobia bacterium]|nr:hypothetical protein [Candidatus Neomarinimicrobiota bacterium]MBL7023714.1 hypothetical protein [Candidatus Neomarinimicrobiota bacterium]MBL7109495.1 hypothetical protein [Candidatus Neomarinimicrobiota bacterium]
MNLKTSEGKQEFITEKLSTQLTEVSDKYGKVLVDELISRLEDTIKDFNGEMNILFEDLKQKELKRQKMLDKIKSEKNLVKEAEVDKNKNGQSVSEWEKRLEEIEKEDKE